MSTSHAPGLPVEVHGHPNADTLLLWHPAVTERADDLAALATRIAARGRFRVVVPQSPSGRDLLRSVRFARESATHPPDQLAVIGYGAAGLAALGLALRQRPLGIGLARVTCVDADPDAVDPISGAPVPPPDRDPGTGTKVDVVAPADEPGATWARRTADAWAAADWAATLVPAGQFTWRL